MVNSNDVPGAAPQYRVYAVKYAFPGLDGIAVRLDGSDGGDDHIRR